MLTYLNRENIMVEENNEPIRINKKTSFYAGFFVVKVFNFIDFLIL